MNDQVSREETSEILRLAEQCLDLVGDYVEFGCYRGDTSVTLAKLLQEHWSLTVGELSPRKCTKLYAYDSFAGLPEKSSQDISAAGVNFQPGVLHVSRRALIDKLKKHGLNNVVIKKAWFDQLAAEDLPEHIAFAFLDGDFYESQRTALALVYPRLTERGMIVCHDYNNPELPGATLAVDEFLCAHPEFRLKVHYTLAILAKKC